MGSPGNQVMGSPGNQVMGSPGTVSSSGRQRRPDPIPFGSPASIARSSERDSMADRLESELLVQRPFKITMINYHMMGSGITVSRTWNQNVLKSIFESIHPHPWIPVFLMGFDDDHIRYCIDKVRLVTPGMQLLDQKPEPDPKKESAKQKGKPSQIWLWGRYLNDTTERYSTWHIRVHLNGTVFYTGMVPEDIRDPELSLQYTTFLTKFLVQKYLPLPVAGRICSFEARVNNICGNLQFNGCIQDPAATALKWTQVDGIRMSWEPEITPTKLYITQFLNTPDYLTTPQGRENSHISMTQTGYVEIKGARSWEDMKVTVKATDQLLDDFVSQGDIIINGQFSSNPRGVDRVLSHAEMANNLTGGDLGLLHENMLDHFPDDDDQTTIDAIDVLGLHTPDRQNSVMIEIPVDVTDIVLLKSDGSIERRSPTPGTGTPRQLTPAHSTGDLRIDTSTRTPTPEPEAMNVAYEAQLDAAAAAAVAAVEKAETEAGSRTPIEFTPAHIHGSLEDAPPPVKDAPPLVKDARGSLSDDVTEVKPKKKRGRGKEKPQREPKEPKKKKDQRSEVTGHTLDELLEGVLEPKKKEEKKDQRSEVTGQTLDELLEGVFPFTQAKDSYPGIGEDIYFRYFERPVFRNGKQTVTNDYQFVRYDKEQKKVVIFRGVNADGFTPEEQKSTNKIMESHFLRSVKAVTRWENLFLEDTTPAATVVTRAAPTVVRDVYEPTIAAAEEPADVITAAEEQTTDDVAQAAATPEITAAEEQTTDDVAQAAATPEITAAEEPVNGMFEHFEDDTESGEVPVDFDSHVTIEPLSTEIPHKPPGMGDRPTGDLSLDKPPGMGDPTGDLSLEWTPSELACLRRSCIAFTMRYRVPNADLPKMCFNVLQSRGSQKTLDQVQEKLIEMNTDNYFAVRML